MAEQQSDGRVKCCQCGDIFEQIGNHWSQSPSCEYPPLSETKKEMLVGSLMGDGCVGGKQYKNQHITVKWSSKEQCQWLDSEFEWLSTGVSLQATAEEAAETCRKSFGTDTTAEDCSAYYRVCTRKHPEITKLTSWYSTGDKVWPAELDLTPTTLLLWFVGDGNYDNSGASRCIRIRMNNEADDTEKVYRYLDRKNLPRPSSTDSGKLSVWTVSDSKQLFEYMSRTSLKFPPEGFEYKFPANMGGTGKDL